MNGSFELDDDVILRLVVDLLKKYRATAFFALTYLFTWLFQVPVILVANHLLPINISSILKIVLLTIGSFGPSLISIVLTGIIEGKKGLIELFKKMFLWRANVFWYFFVLFSPAIFYLASIGLFVFTGGNPPVFMNLSKWYLLLPYFLWMFLSGGPLNEELGWRGYALPILQVKNNALVSSLIIGILWSLWHLPLFWLPGHPLSGFPFPLYILITTTSSVLMTWVYNNTNGSLLFPLLFHTSDNVSANIVFIMPKVAGSLLPVYFLTGVSILVVLAVVIMAGPAKLSRNRAV